MPRPSMNAAQVKPIIMVVDSDPRTVGDLSEALPPASFEVRVVRSSLALEDESRTRAPALLILCVDDPIWRDVQRTVTVTKRLRNVPLLLCTDGRAAADLTLHWFEQEGAWAYARKPLDSTFVMQRLGALFPELLAAGSLSALAPSSPSESPDLASESFLPPSELSPESPDVALDDDDETGTLDAIDEIEDDVQYALDRIAELEVELVAMEAVRDQSDALIAELELQTLDQDRWAGERGELQDHLVRLQGELNESSKRFDDQASALESSVRRASHLEAEQGRSVEQRKESSLVFASLREETAKRQEENTETMDLLRGRLQGITDERDALAARQGEYARARAERESEAVQLRASVVSAEAELSALADEKGKLLDEAQERYLELESEKGRVLADRDSALGALGDELSALRVAKEDELAAVREVHGQELESFRADKENELAVVREDLAQELQSFRSDKADEAASAQDRISAAETSAAATERLAAEADRLAGEQRLALEVAHQQIGELEAAQALRLAQAEQRYAELVVQQNATIADVDAKYQRLEAEKTRVLGEAEARLRGSEADKVQALAAAEVREYTLQEQSLLTRLETDERIAALETERRNSAAAAEELRLGLERLRSEAGAELEALRFSMHAAQDLQQAEGEQRLMALAEESRASLHAADALRDELQLAADQRYQTLEEESLRQVAEAQQETARADEAIARVQEESLRQVAEAQQESLRQVAEAQQETARADEAIARVQEESLRQAEQAQKETARADEVIARVQEESLRQAEQAQEETARLRGEAQVADEKLGQQIRALDTALLRSAELEQDSANMTRGMQARAEEFEEDEDLRKFENRMLREELDTLRQEVKILRQSADDDPKDN